MFPGVSTAYCLLDLGGKSRISAENGDPPYVLEPSRVRRAPSHGGFERRGPCTGVVWRMQGAVKRVVLLFDAFIT